MLAAAVAAAASYASPPQEGCRRCGGTGCDVRILDCGCTLHARCTPLEKGSIPLKHCPCCHQATRGIYLIPMSFEELDEARKVAATSKVVGKRGQKRKSATIARLNPASASKVIDDNADDLRTGRWTPEEEAYCGLLVEKFGAGLLPLLDGTKLNDFLAGMLKSKQSRLTKKMKNAKLSTRTFTRTRGYLDDVEDAKKFTQVESDFFASIPCEMERAEIRFHMQKEWREFFSSYCVEVGQPLDADKWMSSVDELDRRMSQAKDAARMARRKKMMGYALSQDTRNLDEGIYIDDATASDLTFGDAVDVLKMFANDDGALGGHKQARTASTNSPSSSRRIQNAPFLGKTISYMQRHGVPFEHVDAWVPSFVPIPGSSESKCRLCFAGSATTEVQIGDDPDGQPFAMSNDDRFDWLAFGEYSQKFSFDVGCGLPGRVYQHGVPSWEQNVENAPPQHFERCGGAAQWGIKTVVAIPIPSPSVGRIVLVLYSRSDRPQDQEMVCRMAAELSKLVPSPKWKLVVDVGTPTLKNKTAAGSSAAMAASGDQDERVMEVLSLIGEHMPSNSQSPLAGYLPGFTSLRLLLMKTNRTPREAEVLGTILGSYSSYVAAGKQTSEIAWLLARDCMHLSQQIMSQQQNAMQSQSFNGFAVAPTIQGNGSFPTAAPTAMALPAVQRLHQGQSFANSTTIQGQPASQDAPASTSAQQNGQDSPAHGFNAGSFG